MNARQRFVDDAVLTASPAKLLCLLYDRLQLDLKLAVEALAEGDRADATRSIAHAQEILLELRASLDVDAWEGGPGLAALYGYLLTRLGKASIDGDATIVTECLGHVVPLREAWHRAASAGAGGASAPRLAASA